MKRVDQYFKDLLLLLIIIINLSCHREAVSQNEEGYTFISSKGEFFLVIQEKYLNGLFKNCNNGSGNHIFLKSTGYSNYSLKKEWFPINLVRGQLTSLGLSKDIVLVTPKTFCTNNATDNQKEECIDVEGEDMVIASSECERSFWLFVNYKDKKIEVKQEYQTNIEEIRKSADGIKE